VITGCGHAGIVNICRYARRLTKERALYAVMGGFHLNGPILEPLIPLVLHQVGFAPVKRGRAKCSITRSATSKQVRTIGEPFASAVTHRWLPR
jgi:metal-dependent hydrolase (beta-lactamase superfamily II)